MSVCLPKSALELHFALVKSEGLGLEKTDVLVFLNDLASPNTARESKQKKALQNKNKNKK